MRFAFRRLLCGVLLVSLGANRPNILWISCEDISPHLGCYGDDQAHTPNLDRLAASGIRYDRAYAVAGVCAVCRASMITSMYASTLGNQFMRCAVDLPDMAKLFPQCFRDAGYFCTNNSKTDYNITGPHDRCWDESNRQAHWRHRPDKTQPFFAVFNLTDTHESRVFNYERPQNLSDDELHDPDHMRVPPYHPDTPASRLDWAHYRDNITSMDKQVAERLAELAEDGLSEETIVVFWSDHGAGLPRSKRWLYESGTRIPLIIRLPARFQIAGQGSPGTVSEQLVSLLDLPATMMNLAGLPIPDHFHGRPFLGEDLPPPREFLVTIRDRMDERYDLIRAVCDSRYKYIRNFEPYKPYFQITNYMEQEHTMKELRRLHALRQLSPAAEQFMADHKPLEELYDLQADPHEVHNLIDQASDRSELKTALDGLRGHLHRWIFDTRDTGLIPESELDVRGQSLGSRFEILRQSGADDLLTRLLATNRLACNTDGGEDELIKASQDPDAAVRYWALVGLANQHANSSAAQRVIRKRLSDDADCVRVAAARAAWRSGDPQVALPVIRQAAQSDQEWVALMAMHLIDDMNEEADSLQDVVEWVQQNAARYPVRVADYLLNDTD